MDLGVFIIMLMLFLPSTITDQSLMRYLIRNDRDEQGYFLSTLVIDQPLMRTSKGPWEIEMEHNTLDKTDGSIIQTIAKALVRTTKGSGPDSGVGTTDDTWTNTDDITEGDSSEAEYIKINGLGCFKLYTKPKTYLKASKTCEKDNAYLNFITNHINKTVLETLTAFTDDAAEATCAGYYYVAGKMFFHGSGETIRPGKYYNAFGKLFVNAKVAPWGPEQPNDPENEMCVAFYKENGIHDVPCDWKLSFICQKEFC